MSYWSWAFLEPILESLTLVTPSTKSATSSLNNLAKYSLVIPVSSMESCKIAAMITFMS